MRAGESPHVCMIWPSTEETGKKNPFFQFFPGRGLTTLFPRCCLSIQLPISQASRCWMWSSPLGHWQFLAHTQLLKATKSKESGLHYYKGLRSNQRLRLGRLTKFIFYIRPRCQEWNGWLFYLMCINQHRDSWKMKKQKNVFPPKNKINFQK